MFPGSCWADSSADLLPLPPQHSGPSQNPTQAVLCKIKEPWRFPLKSFIFRGEEERAACGWIAILAKHPPEIQHMGDAEGRKLQLRWSEMGKAKAAQQRAGQKHDAWLRAKTGDRFNKKDMPSRALACQLGRLPGIQHTIKAVPELGTGPRAVP